MKILTVIPLWKRPEVWEVCAKNLDSFRSVVGWEFRALVVICPHDPHLKELESTCKRYKIKAVYYKNEQLGRKLNAGINYSLKHYQFDYLMNFGSDDLIHPEIERLYEPYFAEKVPFFGLNSLYFHDFLQKRSFFFKCYTDGLALGAARMVSRSILDELTAMGEYLYENKLNRSLDSDSSRRVNQFFKITDTVVESGTFPYVVDVKTHTNINHVFEIETHHKDRIAYVDDGFLKQYFNI